jgi:hypothetical protein
MDKKEAKMVSGKEVWLWLGTTHSLAGLGCF